MNAERAQVLDMLASGKITPEQGAQLLAAIPAARDPRNSDRPAAPRLAERPLPVAGGDRAHWFHIRVSDGPSGRTKVNLTIPLALVRLGLQIGARFAPEIAGLDAEEIVQALRSGSGAGPLIDVQDEDDGEHVEIFVD